MWRNHLWDSALQRWQCLKLISWKSDKDANPKLIYVAYLSLYLLQITIFGNLALSTGVVFETNVVDTVDSWYAVRVLKKKKTNENTSVAKVHLLERKSATTRLVKIVTDQNILPKEEALGRWGHPCKAVLLQKFQIFSDLVVILLQLLLESLDWLNWFASLTSPGYLWTGIGHSCC